jgi:gluconate 2-dehydrogenase gamma chain
MQRMSELQGRRAFLRAAIAASTAWAAADILQVEDALAFASQQVGAPSAAPATTLAPAQMEALVALTSRIIPSVDGRPGAREAGAVYFIDRALATFNTSQRVLYDEGIADLNQRAQRRASAATTFAALAAAQQDEVIREIETTPFFQAARFDTIVGTLALPTWGGNREHLGWHLLGLEHQPIFRPPFGYYDAEINKQQ